MINTIIKWLTIAKLRHLIREYFAPQWNKWIFLETDKQFQESYKQDRQELWKDIPIEYRQVLMRIYNMDVAYLMYKNKEQLSIDETNWNRAQMHKMLLLQKELAVMNKRYNGEIEIVDIQ